MKLNDLLPQIKPPCNTCPYKLGLVQAVINPCPQCRENGYQTFKRFQRELSGGDTKSSSERERNAILS